MNKIDRGAPARAPSLIAAMALPGSPALAQQKTEISLSRQPGIFYMPSHIMEKQKLIEKHAAALGVPGVTTKWVNFSGGGAQTDALLAGGVDILNTGTGNLLLLWDRTRGGVKGIVATSAQPMTLISRDRQYQVAQGFRPERQDRGADREGLDPGDRAADRGRRAFGADQWSKLDANTVQLGHPDAYVAMTNAQHEVRNHFAIPPFTFLELKNVPGAHVVLSSPDVMGGPLSQAQFFTTTKFADANPKIIQAVRDATKEAHDLIRSDTKAAVEIYKEITGDKTSVEDLLAWLKEPGMMEWNLQPQGTMKFAAHLFKTGTLKTQPKAWTDYYLPVAHDLKGN